AILLIFEVLPFLNVPWDLMNDAGLTTRALLDADNFRFVPGSLTGFLHRYPVCLIGLSCRLNH
ncbi:MAG: hypothetical protein ABIJ31_12990, partial [Pseudomonadota bacterium]